MTKEELLACLGSHEDNFIERKSEGVSVREIRKTVCAFANTVEGRSAVLFVGIHDKTGKINGVKNPDELQKRIRTACMDDCYPPISYTSEVLTIEGRTVVATIVPPSSTKPHFTGPAFVRVGSESVKASQVLFDELLLNRSDKCREILRYKHKLITVWSIGYKMSDKRHVADSNYREGRECIIIGCTAHVVSLEEPATGRTYHEALKGVEISHDDDKRRLMLIVRGV